MPPKSTRGPQNPHRFVQLFSEDGLSLSGNERDVLYLNNGAGRFVDVSGVSGLDSISDGRGAVYADFDNDGDADIFVPTIQGQAHLLFRNDIGQRQQWIRVSLVGKARGRDAFGATVRVKTSQGIQTKIKSGGEGFLSQHDPRLLFGLGNDTAAEWIEVRWPSGNTQRVGALSARTHIVVDEATSTFTVVQTPESDVLGGSASVTRIEARAKHPRTMRGEAADGRAVNLTLRRRTIIALWATWCSMCREDLDALATAKDVLAANGYEVIAMSVDEDQAAFSDFVRNRRLPFRVMRLSAGSRNELFKGQEIAVPAALITDGRGGVDRWLTGRSAILRFIHSSTMPAREAPTQKRKSQRLDREPDATPATPDTASGRSASPRRLP